MIPLFISTLIAVFLLGMQQINVVRGHYTRAALTSFLIAAAQCFMIRSVVSTDGLAFVVMGSGGAIGILAAMWMHRNRK